MIDWLRVQVQRWLELDILGGYVQADVKALVDLRTDVRRLRDDQIALAAEVVKLKPALERQHTRQTAEADPHLGRL